MPKLNQRGIIHLIPLFILLIGIVAGVYLVQKTQIFKPKAASENVEFSGSCVSVKDGQRVLTCPQVQIKFVSPLESGQTSDAGFSFVKEAYAVGPGQGGANRYCKDDDRSKIYHKVCDIQVLLLDFCYPWIYDHREVTQSCDLGTECTPRTATNYTGTYNLGAYCEVSKQSDSSQTNSNSEPAKYTCEGENVLVIEKDSSTVKIDCFETSKGLNKCGSIDGVARCIDVVAAQYSTPSTIQYSTPTTQSTPQDQSAFSRIQQRQQVINTPSDVSTTSYSGGSITPPQGGAGVGSTSPVTSRITISFRFAEDPEKVQQSQWINYTPGGTIVAYVFNDPTPDDKPRFIYTQFKDNLGNTINAKPYPVSIVLVKETVYTPTPSPAATPVSGGSYSTPSYPTPYLTPPTGSSCTIGKVCICGDTTIGDTRDPGQCSDCNGGWCNGGKCANCSGTSYSYPTPSYNTPSSGNNPAPIPGCPPGFSGPGCANTCVANATTCSCGDAAKGRSDDPGKCYPECSGGWCRGGLCVTCNVQ